MESTGFEPMPGEEYILEALGAVTGWEPSGGWGWMSFTELGRFLRKMEIACFTALASRTMTDGQKL